MADSSLIFIIEKVFRLTGTKVPGKKKGTFVPVVADNKNLSVPIGVNVNLISRAVQFMSDKGDMFEIFLNKPLNGEKSLIVDTGTFTKLNDKIQLIQVNRLYQTEIFRKVVYATFLSNTVVYLNESLIDLRESFKYPFNRDLKDVRDFYNYKLSDGTQYLTMLSREAQPKPIDEEAKPAA